MRNRFNDCNWKKKKSDKRFTISDHVLEALANTPLDVSRAGPSSVLEERWIKEAVTRSGMKFRWEKLSEEPQRHNRDAVPR